jgi:hypothetical protein
LLSTAATFYHPEQTMTEPQLETEFNDWWKQSFPNSPAGKHAVATHVGFAQYLLQKIDNEQQREQGR